MTQDLIDRFEEIARGKLGAVQEAYADLDVAPDDPGDKAVTQRHTAFKAILTHIALLQKMLGLGPAQRKAAASAAVPAYYDEAELDAMLAEVREARDD